MSNPVRLGGFYSTFDTESVITQLTNIRMAAVTQLEIKSAKAAGKKSGIASVQSAVTSLLAKLSALSNVSSVSGKTATSSNAAISASPTPSSQLGQFTIDITRLATGTRLAGSPIAAPIDATKSMNESNFGSVPSVGSYTIATATGGAHMFGVSGGTIQGAALLNANNTQLAISSGTFTVTTATGGTSTIIIDAATQSMDDVVAAINVSGVGVTATITNDAYGHANQLTLASTQGNITLGSGTDTSNFLSATNLLSSAGTTTRTSSANITKMMTLNEVVADINASAIGISASITNDPQGRANIVSVVSTQGNITFGNGADTSNFLAATALITSPSGATRSSATPLSRASQSTLLQSTPFNTGTVAAGAHNLIINGTSVAYDSSTDTLNDVVNRINTSDAGVTARYDSVSDAIKFMNTRTGPLSLTVADDGLGGDLAARLGLLGPTVSAGENATYSIDGGPSQASATNTISHDGVGLTFTALTSGSPATVVVAQDTAAATTAVKGFVTEFNAVLTTIDKATKADGSKTNNQSGPLSGDASLRQLKSDLRSIVGGLGVNINGSFSTLSQIGLSFGPIGSALGTTNSLQFDETKFKASLADDSAGTQSLLSALTLSASLDPGGTSSITGLSGTYTGTQSGKYSIADDGLGNLVSTFTPANGGPAATTSAIVAANGSTTLLIPGMAALIGPLLQAGTHTVSVTASSQSVVQRLKQFTEVQAGAGGVLQKRQDAFTKIASDIADRIETVQTRIEREMEVLRKKFAAMEQAQARSQGIISQLQQAAANNANSNNN